MSARGPFQDRPGLRVEALSLARGERTLFTDLSFAAPAGAYVEIRGPNGSGKTSLLRSIAGFPKPRAGRIAFDNVEEPALALHVVGHLNGLKGAASARAHLRYWAGLLGGRANEEDALRALELAGAGDAPARTLSQGQQRRLALARLLVAARPIWLLDEPAAALDARGRALFAEMLAAHCARGGAALAAVHEPLGRAPDFTVTLGRA